LKLGCVSIALRQFDVEQGLRLLQRLGIEAIEIGCAGYHVPKYGDPERLLADRRELERWQASFQRYGLEISALAIHGQPLTPNREAAAEYSRQFRQACRLAEAAGITRLTLLAGLPEGAPGDTTACWIVAPHPPENTDVYRWQWEERVIPYWREHGKIAEDHGCRLCFEMHPGDVVYNPRTLARLREEVGPVIGCNFDPSHLFWQGIDPLEAIRFLGDAIYHVHAKDTGVQTEHARLNGLLDPQPQASAAERGWVFRIPGFGHDPSFWREFVTTLRMVGYDDVVSIEHEDEYVGVEDGLEMTCSVLLPMLPKRPLGLRWWEAADEPEILAR
jgi:sugar phosphate isomerase/epimerase